MNWQVINAVDGRTFKSRLSDSLNQISNLVASPGLHGRTFVHLSGHEMDGRSLNFGTLSTWTCGRVSRPWRPWQDNVLLIDYFIL